MIIGLSGYMGSGKDTAGKMVQELTMVKNRKTMEDEFGRPLIDTKGNYVTYPDKPLFTIKKFAAKLKQIASLMTGIPIAKFEDQEFKESNMSDEWSYPILTQEGPRMKKMTVREFLQRLGTDAVRHGLHKDAWVISTMSEYKDDDNWIITDVRFPNEAQAIKDRGGIVIRINRDVPGVSQKFIDRSESEISLDDWDFDYKINNLGSLDDLRNQVGEILRQIKLL